MKNKMKTLRIVFISVLAITTIVGCIWAVLFVNEMVNIDDKVGIAMLPGFTIMSATVIYLTEFILYRTVGDLFVKKERYSKFATVLNILAVIFSATVILLYVCIAIFPHLIFYPFIWVLFPASVILRYEGASLNRKIKKANKPDNE